MKAVLTLNPGRESSLVIENRPAPEAQRGEIRVAVAASALNRADLLQRMGHYPPPRGAPADIGGLEYAGTVETAGEGVTLWSPGDRVMGIVAGGAHAEFVVVHEREAIAVPPALDLAAAAAIPEAFLTAYDALYLQLGLRAGRSVLIHAVGSGVGTAAVQLARNSGQVILGTSRTPEKLERAKELGLQHAILAEDDWLPEVREAAPAGVDAVLDLVGAGYLAGNLQAVAPGGQILVVGLVSGREAPLDLSRLLSHRISIMGTVLRSRPIEEKISLARGFSGEVLPDFAAGKLIPVVHTVLPFESIDDGYRLLASNETYGKIVIRW